MKAVAGAIALGTSLASDIGEKMRRLANTQAAPAVIPRRSDHVEYDQGNADRRWRT